jgi:CDP-diacylglycerol--glycerol-3-phosphate 3-phosphatidyltransferase
MNVGYWLLQPLGRALQARRVSPNTITTAGLILAVAASAAIVFGRLGLAGVLLLAAALCDALDGMVARLGQSVSAGGAVYDAVTDRVEEILVFSAVAFSARAVPWVAALSVLAMIASLMNSYVSAKAEVYDVEIPGGRMRRGERAAWVILGCLMVPLAELTSPLTHLALSSLPLVICLAVIALGTVTSATVRAVVLVASLGLRAPRRDARTSSARPAAVQLLATANKGDLPTR